MWFRYNASRLGVMATLLGRGRAADKRVTNHDGWQFNGLPTLQTFSKTNDVAKHHAGSNRRFPYRIFNASIDYNWVRQDIIVRETMAW